MLDIQIHTEALDPERCRHFVGSPETGAIVDFIGTVRQQTQGKTVLRLEFEAYVPMALSEMQKIAEQAIQQFDLLHICMQHRVGVLEVGDIPVIIAVSAAHRGAAFAACQFCIDQLKETVPIWKKEIFEDGEVWVAAHP
jgi:molybdopterin synthase catalytic subunit